MITKCLFEYAIHSSCQMVTTIKCLMAALNINYYISQVQIDWGSHILQTIHLCRKQDRFRANTERLSTPINVFSLPTSSYDISQITEIR